MIAGARHYTELTAWQRADEIRVKVFGLTARPAFRRNFTLRERTEDAVQSICRNIGEGFTAANPVEFRDFLLLARRSINELLDALRSAERKGYISSDDLAAVTGLVHRIYPELARLIRYLEGLPAQ